MVGLFGQALSGGLIAYLSVGLAVAISFLALGLTGAHPAARGGWAFRPLLIPGLTLLWPYVLVRWRRGPVEPPIVNGQRRQRAAHARIWLILAFIPPLILLGGMALRQGGPLEAPAQRLSAP